MESRADKSVGLPRKDQLQYGPGSTKLDFTAGGCDVDSLTRPGTKTRSGHGGLPFQEDDT
jgi:hypothetical protein